MVNIALAGGGTAGHTSPLIATAHAITAAAPDSGIVVIGTPKGLETRVIPAAGLELKLVPPVPLPRKPSPDLFKVPVRLLGAVNRAKAILREARADVLVGFGGYVAMPAYLAAKQLKLPIVVHEQNAIPGLANKVATRLGAEIYTTFPDTPLTGAEFIGLPLRPEIAGLDRAAEHERACRSFDLNPQLPVLLVSGGSQGARSINEAVTEAFPKLLAEGIQILHVLGQKNFTSETVAVTDAETGAVYRPVAYVDAMEDAYAAGDLMLGRSGAGTVVETAVVGLPTVLVPLPHGNGEQARNAESLVVAGGARLLEDSALSARWLHAEIPTLIKGRDKLDAMSRAGRELMPADAAQVLAQRVLAAARRR
ncbi:undecaprenyldiphospho-muramoylpentapeptide beta-N-acetylglucosaminyltransferase [Ammonicoccus fulvus]|uniref:UDP-N-acetylglucosamine--N-acetylmuramyl-(pentapeptide) pyrophosphoryl-undecaprenol N-acetylglucosamine transferase n=1 Tax=Ammonicoccus fulvus TaxID=3138240 RepID=A0ABZ3FU09_9ACTN